MKVLRRVHGDGSLWAVNDTEDKKFNEYYHTKEEAEAFIRDTAPWVLREEGE